MINTPDIEAMFPSIVGQPRAKSKLAFLVENARATKVIPHLLFVGQKGGGKTSLAKAVAKQLHTRNGRIKPCVNVVAAEYKDIRGFLSNIYMPHMRGREVTLFFDEAHSLNPKLATEFLKILEINKDNKTSYLFDGSVYEFDFKMHSFLFATTESQKILPPLMSRFERVDLEDYSLQELAQIIGNTLEGITFSSDLLLEIASAMRPVPRESQKVGNRLRDYLSAQKKKYLSHDDWRYVKERLGILPLGLNQTELKILRSLDGTDGTSLTALSSITGMSRGALQADSETYLLARKLIDISSRGRKLTLDGRIYLQQLEHEQTNS